MRESPWRDSSVCAIFAAGGTGSVSGAIIQSVCRLYPGRRLAPSYFRRCSVILPAREFRMPVRLYWLPLLLCVAAYGAGDARSTPQSAQDAARKADRLLPPLAIEFRMFAAQALQGRHPDLARKVVDTVLEQLRTGKDWNLESSLVRALAEVAPDDAI